MNTEYMKLTNGSTIITNEKGHITEREGNINQDLLMAENKIEIVNNEIIKIDDKIIDQLRLKLLSKKMLIWMPVIYLGVDAITSIITYLTSDLTFSQSIAQSLYSWLPSEILSLSIIIPNFSIALFISNKKIKKLERKMKKANELCREYEKELEKTKEENKRKEENIILKPISLENQNIEEQKEIDEHLQKAYSPKKRVLRK